MFQRLTVRGLGPHEDFSVELNPGGIVEIAGPSEAGKSTLIEAICLALWGRGSDGRRFRKESIREGAARAEVILESAGGGVIRRVVERSGGATRSLRCRGEPAAREYGAERTFARAIGPLGAQRAGAAGGGAAAVDRTDLLARCPRR